MQKSTNKLLHFVSIRGLAAWLVVFLHSIALINSAMPQATPFFFRFIEQGYLAVDFFFVLSGFIIFINYYEKFGSNFRHNSVIFFWNRISRIYPVHATMLVAYLILAMAFNYFSESKTAPSGYTVSSFWQSVFLVHAWTGTPLTWNVPSWSISAEWFVYLLFPFIAVFFQARIHGIIAHLLAAAVVLLTICVIYSLFGISSLGTFTYPTPLVRALLEFLMGAIAGSLFIHHIGYLVACRKLIAAMIVGLGAVIFFFKLPNFATVPLLFFLFVVYLSIDTSWIAKILSNRFLVYIGEISYSTYMVHYFIYDVFKAGWIRDGQPVTIVHLIISFLAVLIFSILMHRFVELPAQKHLRTGLLKKGREPLRFRP